MKLNKIILSACAVASIGTCMTSCKDDDMFTLDGQEAFLIYTDKSNSPYVDYVDENGAKMRFYSRVSNDTVYIQLNPQFDPDVVLKENTVKFFVSKGSLVEPDPSIPQDFTVEGGVKYTIISEDGKTRKSYVFTHGLTDLLPEGSGASLGIVQVTKTFPELGYPGEVYNFTYEDSRLYGDLNGYVAYCGHDQVVLFARQYNDPVFGDPVLSADRHLDLSFKVFNSKSLAPEGELNVSTIGNPQMIRAMSSDWHGNLVAVVLNGSSTDIYTWTKASDAPRLVANVPQNLCMATDGSNYVQISGDINGKANLTCPGQRGVTGEHYMLHFENGQITETSKISTGYSSGDCGGFQNISALTDELHSDYVVGDSEGAAGTGNTVRVYINTFAGNTKLVMPNVLQSVGVGGFHDWWIGTGGSLNRTGAHRPYVSAMPINGKTYVMLLNGSAFWYCNTLVDAADLQTRISGAEIDIATNGIGWGFGATGDWYWDEETHEAAWVTWGDRYGMHNANITCYE